MNINFLKSDRLYLTARSSLELYAMSNPDSPIAQIFQNAINNRRSENQRNLIKRHLDQWCNEPNITETEKTNRRIAATKIQNCYTNGETKLDLSGLGLTSLPKGLDFLTSLKRLDLSCNHLTTFASDLPASLESLILSDNQLRSFSSDLPASLEWLTLSDNQLRSFSSALPASLETLDLEKNQLRSFSSDLPASLVYLSLNKNHLTTFSSALPPSLQFLFLSNNQLHSFSSALPPSLEALFLAFNELPSSEIQFHIDMNTLPELSLYLSMNPCAETNALPGTNWLRVPSGVIQDIPEILLNRLGIEVLPRPTTGHNAEKSLEDRLAQLFHKPKEKIQTKYETLLKHPQASALAPFIRRMRSSWNKYIPSIQSIIDLANINPQFQNLLFEEVYSISTNCDDRPLYFFSRLSAQAATYQMQTDKNDRMLVQNLIALKHLRVIEDCAQEISVGEALEIALYLQLKLKSRLSLPIAIDSMAHQTFAEDAIQSYLENEAAKTGSPPRSIDEWVDEVHARCLSISATDEQKLAVLAESRLLQEMNESETVKQCQEDYANIFNDIFTDSIPEEPVNPASATMEPEEPLNPDSATLDIANRFLGTTDLSVKELQQAWKELPEQQQLEIINNLSIEQETKIKRLRASGTKQAAQSLLSRAKAQATLSETNSSV